MSIIYTLDPRFSAPTVDFLATVTTAEASVFSECCSAALLVEGVDGLLWELLICCLPAEERQRGSWEGLGTTLILLFLLHLPLLSSSLFHLWRYFQSLPLSIVPPIPAPHSSPPAEVTSDKMGEEMVLKLKGNGSRSQMCGKHGAISCFEEAEESKDRGAEILW